MIYLQWTQNFNNVGAQLVVMESAIKFKLDELPRIRCVSLEVSTNVGSIIVKISLGIYSFTDAMGQSELGFMMMYIH